MILCRLKRLMWGDVKVSGEMGVVLCWVCVSLLVDWLQPLVGGLVIF